MDESGPVSESVSEPVTVQYALASAARLLLNAELEIDLARMERMEKLADSWISIADTLARVAP